MPHRVCESLGEQDSVEVIYLMAEASRLESLAFKNLPLAVSVLCLDFHHRRADSRAVLSGD